MYQLQTADGELIQTHVLILLNTRDRSDMSYLCVLSLLELLKNGSCSDNSRLQMVDTKTLKVLNLEVVQKLLF